MSVSAELLCSFELLKPLDSSALKSHIKKGRNKRNNMLNSPVCRVSCRSLVSPLTNPPVPPACQCLPSECIGISQGQLRRERLSSARRAPTSFTSWKGFEGEQNKTRTRELSQGCYDVNRVTTGTMMHIRIRTQPIRLEAARQSLRSQNRKYTQPARSVTSIPYFASHRFMARM